MRTIYMVNASADSEARTGPGSVRGDDSSSVKLPRNYFFSNKKCDYLQHNLNEVSSLRKKIDEASRAFSDTQIDILVNCAGFNPKKGFFDITEEDFDKTMDTNVKGTFFMCQAMAEYMIGNKVKGHILNLSSSSALRPAWSPYEMSKWTIKGLTVGLADSLIKHGIVVNAIAPGQTATPMLGVSADGDIDLPTSPIGRYATPDEIANLALILVSDMGNLIVGDTLYATGGSGVISLHR